jgi:hypothetical protein
MLLLVHQIGTAGGKEVRGREGVALHHLQGSVSAFGATSPCGGPMGRRLIGLRTCPMRFRACWRRSRAKRLHLRLRRDLAMRRADGTEVDWPPKVSDALPGLLEEVQGDALARNQGPRRREVPMRLERLVVVLLSVTLVLALGGAGHTRRAYSRRSPRLKRRRARPRPPRLRPQRAWWRLMSPGPGTTPRP